MELTAHSDILVHWTGKWIEKDFLNEGIKNSEYVKLLKNLLRFGLRMNKSKKEEILKLNRQEIKKPLISRICFTELKLSMSEDHAQRYGRLGIGVKRYFLFDRLGSPMHYCQAGTENLFFPPYSNVLVEEKGYEILSFFKHMCTNTPKEYDLYNESEWRIIFSESIRRRLIKNGRDSRTELFVDPKNTKDTELTKYYRSLSGKKPDYLIPLDPWLAIVIYPNLKVKKLSVEDQAVRELLKLISLRPTVTGCPERGCLPMELDLAACKNF